MYTNLITCISSLGCQSTQHHEYLRNMIGRVNQQAGRNQDFTHIPINTLAPVDLPTSTPSTDHSPIYETTYNEWLRLSRSQQQYIFKNQNILLHGCPVPTQSFNLAAFRDLLGGVDTLRVMHGLCFTCSKVLFTAHSFIAHAI